MDWNRVYVISSDDNGINLVRNNDYNLIIRKKSGKALNELKTILDSQSRLTSEVKREIERIEKMVVNKKEKYNRRKLNNFYDYKVYLTPYGSFENKKTGNFSNLYSINFAITDFYGNYVMINFIPVNNFKDFTFKTQFLDSSCADKMEYCEFKKRGEKLKSVRMIKPLKETLKKLKSHLAFLSQYQQERKTNNMEQIEGFESLFKDITLLYGLKKYILDYLIKYNQEYINP